MNIFKDGEQGLGFLSFEGIELQSALFLVWKKIVMQALRTLSDFFDSSFPSESYFENLFDFPLLQLGFLELDGFFHFLFLRKLLW